MDRLIICCYHGNISGRLVSNDNCCNLLAQVFMLIVMSTLNRNTPNSKPNVTTKLSKVRCRCWNSFNVILYFWDKIKSGKSRQFQASSVSFVKSIRDALCKSGR